MTLFMMILCLYHIITSSYVLTNATINLFIFLFIFLVCS